MREADEGDVDVLTELNALVHDIHVAALPEHFKRLEPATVAQWFRATLSKRDARACLAVSGESAVGYALASFHDRPESAFCFARRICELDQIAVAPAFRRRGVARALMDHVLAVARAEGIPSVELTSWSFNADAHRAFEALGFRAKIVRFGRRP